MPDLLLQEQPSRRGLLRTLIAAPVAAMATHKLILPAQAGVAPAEREALLDAYSEWLDNERRLLHLERFGKESFLQSLAYVPLTRAGQFHFPARPDDWEDRPRPSTRAAQVLASVGCDWRERP